MKEDRKQAKNFTRRDFIRTTTAVGAGAGIGALTGLGSTELLAQGLGGTAAAQQDVNAAPDAIFYNGKIITVDSAFTIQQAFAVRGDQYVAVGTNAGIRALAGKNTRQVDLQGAAVIPGLTDNHDHLYNSEKVMRGVNLVGATSTDEVMRRLRDGMAKAKPGETVYGSIGFRAQLTKKDLDQLSTEVPIVVLRSRRSEALLNTAALKKAGITKDMQSYMGVPIPKDPRFPPLQDPSGELNGNIPAYPAGLYAIDNVVPPPTAEEEDRMIEDGQKQRNALGITSIRELTSIPAGMRAFQRMALQGKLTLRVSLGLEILDWKDPAGVLRQQAVIPGFGDHWVRIDSAGESPWPPNDLTQQDYAALMIEMNRLGWRHAPHTPDNEALEMVLQGYEAADRESSIRDKRWVIEHIPNVTPPLMARLAKLNVIVSTNMAGYTGNYDAAVRNLGQEQADRQTPVRELLDHGLVVVPGSDYGGPSPETTTSNNPFIPLYYYVSRKNAAGKVLGAQEKVSREEALRLATNNNAFVTWEEKVKGSIEAGKLADFVVLSGDYMTVPEDEILKLHPMATYVGGHKAYEAPDAKGNL